MRRVSPAASVLEHSQETPAFPLAQWPARGPPAQIHEGTFSLRSPVRPNPIGTSIVKLVGIEGSTVLVRGLDCLDQTPLLDLKPDRCEFSPLAAQKAGNVETE